MFITGTENLERVGLRNVAKSSITRPSCLIALVAISLFAVSVIILGQGKKLRASEAKHHIGQQATVCGRVASGRYVPTTHGSPTFLYFDKPYPNQPFTVIIWGHNRAKFKTPETTYRDKSICVTGRIGIYRGEPEIIASEPAQISADIEKAERPREVWPTCSPYCVSPRQMPAIPDGSIIATGKHELILKPAAHSVSAEVLF
jgi:hypothetical protein